MKIFAISENKNLDYTDAERFGELIFMTKKDIRKNNTQEMNRKIINDIKYYMSEFDPDEDFLLLSGDPILIGYAFSLSLLKKNYVRVIKWSQTLKSYYEFHFNPESM